MSDTYNASNIELLKGLEPVRKNPSMYIGNTGFEGLHHMVYELIDNSVDEYLAGYCKNINIEMKKDGSISVEDDGRGIPVDIHKKENVSALELVMTKLHAGGKFNRENYKISGGLHGVGASIITALSDWCYVEVRRNKKVYKQEYSRGHKTSEVDVVGKTKNTGTKTVFYPDKKIFDVLKFDFETVSNRIKERAYLNSNLYLSLYDEKTDKKVEYKYDGGVRKFVSDINEKLTPIHDDIIYIHQDKKSFDFEVAFQYIRRSQDHILSFANNINTVNGGTHLNAFKNAALKVIDELIQKNKLLKGLNLRVLPRDITDGLTAIVNVKLPDPQFEGQTKAKLNNQYIREEAEELCKKELFEYFKKNQETTDRIVNRIAESIKARDAANKAKKLIKRKSGFDALDLPVKLTDCVSKEMEECEVYLVEGDSAGGGLKTTRDKKTQAILSLKGKVLNVEGTTLNKILESQEIKNIISSLGIDIKKANTEVAGLRYNKIIILTDADDDGQHITALLLTLFYRYMRKIIEDGHLYIARPPLYRIIYGNKAKYIDTEKELEEMMKKHKNIVIQRFKGLGEMNPDQLYETTVDPEKRVLDLITIEDADKAEELLNILMGSEPSLRRQFIFENAKEIEVFV